MAIPDSLLRDLEELQGQVTELAAREVNGFYVPWYNSNNVEPFYTNTIVAGTRIYSAPIDRALTTLKMGLRIRATSLHDGANYWNFTFWQLSAAPAALFTVNSIGYSASFAYIPITNPAVTSVPETWQALSINLDKVGSPGPMEVYPVWYAVP